MRKPFIPKPTLETSLKRLLEKADGKEVELRQVFDELAGRGYPLLLVFIALPFCLPVQIPGLSTPFGLILAFMGFQIALGKRMHWPEKFLERKLSYNVVSRLVAGILKVVAFFKKIVQPRLLFWVQDPTCRRLHGLLVCLLALILALPLPIPFTNILMAGPIVLIGVALLEDDGLLLSVAYALSTLSFVYLFLLIWLGDASIRYFFSL